MQYLPWESPHFFRFRLFGKKNATCGYYYKVNSIYIAFLKRKFRLFCVFFVVKNEIIFNTVAQVFCFGMHFRFSHKSLFKILSWEEVSQQPFSFEFVLWKIDQIEDLKLRFKLVIELIWKNSDFLWCFKISRVLLYTFLT